MPDFQKDSSNPDSSLTERLNLIKGRIASSCKRSGRSVSEVTLVGVTKTIPYSIIGQAIEAGLTVLGENRVQEAADKIVELRPVTAHHSVEWHLIGQLQSNKARRAVELFDAIHSLDSMKLAERLDGIAAESGRRLPVFLEVNLGAEQSKAGATETEALQLCEKICKLPNLILKGLMTVPPFLDDPEEIRPFFKKLRELRDQAIRAGIVDSTFKELSMGMSNDFETAIEEGSTYVRVGTAIFGSRS